MTTKTLLPGGDLLACVLGGVYTDVEKTMIELQRTTIVDETRSAFQNAMQHKFITAIERLSGREVLTFMLTPSRRRNAALDFTRERWRIWVPVGGAPGRE